MQLIIVDYRSIYIYIVETLICRTSQGTWLCLCICGWTLKIGVQRSEGKPPSLQATLLSTDFLILFIGQILKCYSLALPFFSSVPLGNLLVIWSNRCQRFLHAELHNENLCKPTHPYGSYPPRSPLTSAEISWVKRKWFRLRVHHVARRTQDLFSQPSEKQGPSLRHPSLPWPWCRGTADMAPSACSLQIEPARWKLQGNMATLGQPNFHSSFWWICLPELRRLKMKFQWWKVDMHANSKPWLIQLILKLFRNSPKNPPQPGMSSWENGCNCDSLGPPSHHRIERPTDHLGDLVQFKPCVDQHPMGPMVQKLKNKTSKQKWVCLKMVSTPKNPMVLLIIIPTKWLFHWEYTPFSDKPWIKFMKVWIFLSSNSGTYQLELSKNLGEDQN